MNKRVRVILKDEAKESFEMQLIKSIKKKVSLIKENFLIQ